MSTNELASKISAQILKIIEPLALGRARNGVEDLVASGDLDKMLEMMPFFSMLHGELQADVRKDIVEKYQSFASIPNGLRVSVGAGKDPDLNLSFLEKDHKRVNYLLTNKAWELYFDKTASGYAIGYHVEGGETYEETGTGKPLSLESLDNRKLLYLCANPDEWWPAHLPDAEKLYTVYTVIFKPPTTLIISEHDVYMDLFMHHDVHDDLRLSPKGQALADLGVGLVIYPGKDDRKELSESFLITPRRSVLSISSAKVTRF